MIFESLEAAKLYYKNNQAMNLAFSSIEKFSATPFQKGTWSIDGENMYLAATEYGTTPLNAQSLMEAHRKYIDVMFLLEGQECIFCKPTEQLGHIVSSYSVEDDCLLAKVDADATPNHFYQGQVAVLFPDDAHCPGCCIDSIRQVKKLICKVSCDYYN